MARHTRMRPRTRLRRPLPRAAALPRAGMLICAGMLAALAGCGSGGTVTPSPSGPSSAAPSSTAPSSAGASLTGTAGPSEPATKPGALVLLVRTGGLAGVRQSLAVEPDGRWTYSDGGRTENGRLTADQRAALDRLLADPKLAAEARQPSPTTRTCADGFVYTLAVGGLAVTGDECAAADKEKLFAVVRLLTDATAF